MSEAGARVIDPEAAEQDAAEASLRPVSLDDFVGQQQLRSRRRLRSPRALPIPADRPNARGQPRYHGRPGMEPDHAGPGRKNRRRGDRP